MDKDITTAVQRIQLSCSANLSEDLAYQITEAIYENLDTLATYHASLKPSPAKPLPTPWALIKTRAIKYFEESGLM